MLLSVFGLVVIAFSITKFGTTPNNEIVKTDNYSEDKNDTNVNNFNSVVSNVKQNNFESNTNNSLNNSQIESTSFTQKDHTTRPSFSVKKNVAKINNSQSNVENNSNTTTPVKEKITDSAVNEVSENNSHKNTTEVPKKSNSIKNDEQDLKNVSENDWAKNNSETKEESQVMESLSETTANISSQKTDNQNKSTTSTPENSTKDPSSETKSILENDLPAAIVGITMDPDSSNSKDRPTESESKEKETETTPFAAATIEDIPKPKKLGFLLTFESGLNISSPLYVGIKSDFYKNNHNESNTINYKFDANILFNNGFLIGSGIGFNKNKNNFEYKSLLTSYETTILVDSIYVLDSYIYDTVQQQQILVDRIYHYDDNSTTTIDSTTTEEINKGITKVSYFSIPLNIGYQFPYKKFLFEVQGNLKYNILQNAEGGYYNNNIFIMFDKSSNLLYKKSYFDYSFKLGVHYNIWRQLYLSSSLRFAPRFNSIYSIQEVEKKIQVTNVSLGLSYKF